MTSLTDQELKALAEHWAPMTPEPDCSLEQLAAGVLRLLAETEQLRQEREILVAGQERVLRKMERERDALRERLAAVVEALGSLKTMPWIQGRLDNHDRLITMEKLDAILALAEGPK